MAARRDYNAEGRRLIQNLQGTRGGAAVSKYNDMDAVYTDPHSKATIYVGNESAARGPTAKLLAAGITHVVNCTDDMHNFCEVAPTFAPHPTADSPRIQYLRFNIACWSAAGDMKRETPASEADD